MIAVMNFPNNFNLTNEPQMSRCQGNQAPININLLFFVIQITIHRIFDTKSQFSSNAS